MAMFWAVFAVAVVVIIGVVVFIVVWKALHRAPIAGYDRSAPRACAANGHTYRIEGTAWRCAVCGNHVPRVDGELYGPSEQGRVERRREDRPSSASERDKPGR